MSANHNSHEFQKEVFVPQYFSSKPTVAGKRWRRWQVLVVYGVVVALIAGVIGGFTGKAISDGQRVHRYPSTSFSFSTANGSWAPINGTWTRLLPIPATNCTPRWKRKCLPPTHSEHFTVHYTTLCNTHWADEHLVAISSPTPSDCIEACYSYNKHTQAKKCLGASFVPLWWDQSSAINETGEPFNCLLMGDNKTMAANDADWERVALWLDGSCPEQLVDD